MYTSASSITMGEVVDLTYPVRKKSGTLVPPCPIASETEELVFFLGVNNGGVIKYICLYLLTRSPF